MKRVRGVGVVLLAGLLLSACASASVSTTTTSSQRASIIARFYGVCTGSPSTFQAGGDYDAPDEVGGYNCPTDYVIYTQLDVIKQPSDMKRVMAALEGGGNDQSCFVLGKRWVIYFDISSSAPISSASEAAQIEQAMGSGRFVIDQANGGCPESSATAQATSGSAAPRIQAVVKYVSDKKKKIVLTIQLTSTETAPERALCKLTSSTSTIPAAVLSAIGATGERSFYWGKVETASIAPNSQLNQNYALGPGSAVPSWMTPAIFKLSCVVPSPKNTNSDF